MSAKPESYPVFPAVGDADVAQNVRRPEERRRRQRTQVHWPVKISGSPARAVVESVTRNLSSDGFYCLSNIPLAPGEPMNCTLRLPAHDASGRTLSLQCRIRIVRVEPVDIDGAYGIACRIEDYHFVRTAAAGVQ